MKKNLKINLKRLTSGFISSVMMMSFILMPIPNVSVVYAEDTDQENCPSDDDYKNGAIYVPGCEFNKTLSATSMESDADLRDGGVVENFISQYIVGLMGVILINSLRWKRLSVYNPVVYGNDCQASFGRFSMLPALGGGLAYIIGDIQSNIQFQAAAKKAADEYDMKLTDLQAFTGKSKQHVGDTTAAEGATEEEKKALKEAAKASDDGNNAQLDGYDALAEVIRGQIKALKTKKNMAGISALAYTAADVIELANMGIMHGICISQWSKTGIDKTNSIGSFAAAMAAATTAAAAETVSPVCKAAVGGLTGLKTTEETAEGANLILATVHNVKVVAESTDAASTGLKLMDTLQGVGSNLGNIGSLLGSFGSKAADEAKEAAALVERTARDVIDIGKMSTIKGVLTAAEAVTTPCAPIKALKDKYTSVFNSKMQTTVSCCGGPGVNPPTYAYATGALTAADLTNLFTTGQTQLKKIAKNKLIDVAVEKGTEKILGDYKALLDLFNAGGNAEKGIVPDRGSYWWQGVPMSPGSFSLKKDLKILNLFESGSAAVVDGSQKLNEKQIKEFNNMKFYMKNMFESKLRELAVRSLIDYDLKKPYKTLKSIASVNKKIDGIMLQFDDYLDSDLLGILKEEEVNPNSLAFLKVIKKIQNELFMPKAHAGMGTTLVGFGLTALGGKIDGPWGEVLNVGGKIVMLHGMLGGYAKRYALNRPVGRALLWTTMGLLSNWTRNLTKNSLVKAEDNLKVVIAEKKKFEDSGTSGSGFAGNRSGMGRDSLRNSKYGANQQGKRNIKQCVVADGDNFLPSTCGTVTPKEKFRIKGMSATGDLKTNPMGFANSILTDTLFGAGNDPSYASNMSDGDLAALDSANKAISNLANKKRKEYDDIMKGHKEYQKAGGQSLNNQIAKLRKVLFDNGVSGGGSGLGSSGGSGSAVPLASTKPTETLGTGKVVSGGDSGSGGGGAAPAVPSFDLDFGDEAEVAGGGSDAIGAAKSDKKTEKLGDFVMKHNDINKRKDISIFKILSNRYILSYPKVLEEETQ
jgi:hypothetical protein